MESNLNKENLGKLDNPKKLNFLADFDEKLSITSEKNNKVESNSSDCKNII
jgi:hypothetical protein